MNLPNVELSAGWETVLTGPARQALEQAVLPPFLQEQRWFGGKARRVESVHFVDQGVLPTAGRAVTLLTLLEVRFADGSSDRYFLPLAVTPGRPESVGFLETALGRCVLARLTGPGGEAILHDALLDTASCDALLAMIAEGQQLPTQAGQVQGSATAAFRELRGSEDELPGDVGPETSSNSLVFFGERLLLKLFRRLEVGINPDFEIGRYLTEQTRFTRIPRVGGSIEYRTTRPSKGAGGPMTLALLQAGVVNQGDGWHHALDELSRYFGRASARAPVTPETRSLLDLAASDPPPGAAEVIGAYLATAATLGKRTAELHLALAQDTRDLAFAPEPLNTGDLAALAAEIRAQAERAFTGLRDNRGQLSDDVRASADLLLQEGPRTLERLRRKPVEPGSVVKIRCHGDYHLGQVLWVENDFVILDFEGEPARTVEERRAKQSPLKDVAGMLRSFNYAAYAGLFACTEKQPEDFGRLEPWAELWQQWTAAVFLKEYLATAHGAAFLPREPQPLAALLDAFMLAKAFYELVYELNNRPDWVRLPLRGILALLSEVRGQESGVRGQG